MGVLSQLQISLYMLEINISLDPCMEGRKDGRWQIILVLVNTNTYFWGCIRDPGGGNGILFQYPCPGNAMGRGTWRATVHGVCNFSDMT